VKSKNIKRIFYHRFFENLKKIAKKVEVLSFVRFESPLFVSYQIKLGIQIFFTTLLVVVPFNLLNLSWDVSQWCYMRKLKNNSLIIITFSD
jgi:hypothetical protein